MREAAVRMQVAWRGYNVRSRLLHARCEACSIPCKVRLQGLLTPRRAPLRLRIVSP